jgi:hypothetical protein
MKIPRVVEAMQYLDDDLISEAIKFHRAPLHTRLFRNPFINACACFLAVALLLILTFSHDEGGNVISSPFILTAYASSEDGSATATVLEKQKQFPISRFETSTGLTGFVFSSNKTDITQPSSITIISAGNSDEQIEEIVGVINDPTQNYYIYIPEENEVEPYVFSIFISDEKTNSVYQYKITITQNNGSYYVELSEENIIDRVVK